MPDLGSLVLVLVARLISMQPISPLPDFSEAIASLSIFLFASAPAEIIALGVIVNSGSPSVSPIKEPAGCVCAVLVQACMALEVENVVRSAGEGVTLASSQGC